jgi:Zinc finger, C2H2 type
MNGLFLNMPDIDGNLGMNDVTNDPAGFSGLEVRLPTFSESSSQNTVDMAPLFGCSSRQQLRINHQLQRQQQQQQQTQREQQQQNQREQQQQQQQRIQQQRHAEAIASLNDRNAAAAIAAAVAVIADQRPYLRTSAETRRLVGAGPNNTLRFDDQCMKFRERIDVAASETYPVSAGANISRSATLPHGSGTIRLDKSEYLRPDSSNSSAIETGATLGAPSGLGKDDKPKHFCHDCGKTFKRAHNLKIHGRLHSGDKPYGCPFVHCDKEFRWKSSIVSHLNWHRTKRGDIMPNFDGVGSIDLPLQSLPAMAHVHRDISRQLTAGSVSSKGCKAFQRPEQTPAQSIFGGEVTSKAVASSQHAGSSLAMALTSQQRIPSPNKEPIVKRELKFNHDEMVEMTAFIDSWGDGNSNGHFLGGNNGCNHHHHTSTLPEQTNRSGRVELPRCATESPQMQAPKGPDQDLSTMITPLTSGGSEQASPPLFDLSGMEGLVPQFPTNAINHQVTHSVAQTMPLPIEESLPGICKSTKMELTFTDADNMSAIMFGRMDDTDADSHKLIF